MITKKSVVAVACIAALSGSVVAALEAQGRGKTRKSARGGARQNPALPEMKNGGPLPVIPRAAALLDEHPEFSVKIDPDLQLTPTERTLYENMTISLRDYTDVPTARPAFYSAVTGYTLENWGAVITDVSPIVGGYRVTAFVSPCLLTSGGTTAAVSGRYSEVFDVINGTVTYVNSLDPDGMSGQSLTVISF